MNEPIKNMSLYRQELWDNTYSNKPFHVPDISDPIVVKMQEFLPGGQGHAIEIGCCPGGYSGLLGKMGYTIHGLDLSSSIKDTEVALRNINISCGEFHEKDFFRFYQESTRKYDVVCSFGFVEHFIEFEKIFFLHCKMVAQNGYVFVSFPNFLGKLQFALHSLFDEEGLERHNTHAMDIEPYKKIASALKFKILFAGYFGGFMFWRGHSTAPLRLDPVHLALYQGVHSLLASRAIVGDSPDWSAFGGIIAQKM